MLSPEEEFFFVCPKKLNTKGYTDILLAIFALRASLITHV